mgnify:CR=1 FL=1
MIYIDMDILTDKIQFSIFRYFSNTKKVIRRDEIDSNREFAPLVKAEGAIEIDTTGKDINQVVELVLQKIK